MIQVLDKYGNTSTDEGLLLVLDKYGNVKRIGGGGGSQNLQQVTDIGNVTTNPIEIGDSLIIRNSTNSTYQAQFAAYSLLTGGRTYDLPDASGTLPLTVNGYSADIVGNITVPTGGGGTSRTIASISTNTIAGATAGTDYVYFVSGTTTVTLPTAVGNTNMYTIKRVGTNTVTINTTSSQTIDGSLTASLTVQYTSLSLLSDGANWNIT